MHRAAAGLQKMQGISRCEMHECSAGERNASVSERASVLPNVQFQGLFSVEEAIRDPFL